MRRVVLAILVVVLVTLSCAVHFNRDAPTLTLEIANTQAPEVLATDPALPTLANTPPARAEVIAIRSLNVRERPGETQRVIGYKYFGDPVTLSGNCYKGWAEIEFESGHGWVYADYLSDNLCNNE